MSTVDQLLSQLKSSRGVAKANRYRITFNGNDGNKINVMCDSVTWPGRQIITNDYMTTMKSIKRPYAFMNDDVSASFLLTNDWYTWNFLKQWQSSVINNIDQVTGAYTVNLKNAYVKQVLIEHLNDRDQVVKSVVLFDAYPTTLNGMELSNSSENTILRCTASFSYENWNSRDTAVTTDSTNPSDITTGIGISTIV